MRPWSASATATNCSKASTRPNDRSSVGNQARARHKGSDVYMIEQSLPFLAPGDAPGDRPTHCCRDQPIDLIHVDCKVHSGRSLANAKGIVSPHLRAAGQRRRSRSAPSEGASSKFDSHRPDRSIRGVHVAAQQDDLFVWETSVHWEQWVKELVTTYCFPAEHLQGSREELRVFRDRARRSPLMLVSRLTGEDATEAARAQGFRFIAFGEPPDAHVFDLGSYTGERRTLHAVPTWTPGYRRKTLMPKDVVLLPFQAEDEVRRAFQPAHDAVFKTLATDPAAAFDILLLVFAAKVLDERSEELTYQFGMVERESDHARNNRWLGLLHAAERWLDSKFESPVPIATLPSGVVELLLRSFQDYSFVLTADAAGGTDLLGTAYESIVGSTFRGELGSYFTPRTIADFMARFIDIRDGALLDPACGSAGLLLAAKRLTDNGPQSADLRCYGNDLNPRMARAARVNFLLHGLDPENIKRGDGLQLDQVLSGWFDSNIGSGPWWSAIPDGPFDAVLANPPFAGHENDQTNLARTESALKSDGSMRSLNRTLPFLEAIVASLRIGGRAGVVIPTSVL